MLDISLIEEFNNCLENWSSSSKNIFCEDLLDLIERVFGFNKSGFQILNNKIAFEDVVLNHETKYLKDHYCNHYYKIDFFNSFVTRVLSSSDVYSILMNLQSENIELSLSPANYPINNRIKLIEICGYSYNQVQEFSQYLKEISNFWFTYCVQIGEYRLFICKSKEEGEFTKEELYALQIMKNIILAKYNSYLLNKVHLTNYYVDNFSFGFVLLNGNLQVVECNKKGRSYFDNLEFRSKIISLLTNKAIKKLDLDLEKYHIKIYSSPNNHFSILITEADSKMNELKTAYNLTVREIEIISNLSKGMGYQEIANNLNISFNTVRTHFRNIYGNTKLGINNQKALIAFYNSYNQQ